MSRDRVITHVTQTVDLPAHVKISGLGAHLLSTLESRAHPMRPDFTLEAIENVKLDLQAGGGLIDPETGAARVQVEFDLVYA